MNAKQERFAHEYVIDLNGAQAAIRAGYSANRGTEMAYELLRHPEVAALIEKLMAERETRTGMKQDAVINEMAHLGFSNVNHYTIDDNTGALRLREGAPHGALAAVASVKHKKRLFAQADGSLVVTIDSEITLWDKPKALFLLGRHVGLFPNRVEHSGPGGGPLQMLSGLSDQELAERASALAQELWNALPRAAGALPVADAHAERDLV